MLCLSFSQRPPTTHSFVTATVVKPLGMGLSQPTSRLVYLLCAIWRAPKTCTTIRPCSLGGPGYVLPLHICYPRLTLRFSGGFDAPRVKCPPDRGSSDCVTGSPASIFSRHSDSDYEPDSLQSSIIYPLTPPPETCGSFPSSCGAVAPRPIPNKTSSFGDFTPPLTPDDGLDDCTDHAGAAYESMHSSDALDYLLTIFPQDGPQALPFSRSVSISAPDMGASFDGVVLELPGTPKTLYVDGKSAESVSLRERYAQFGRFAKLTHPFRSASLRSWTWPMRSFNALPWSLPFNATRPSLAISCTP